VVGILYPLVFNYTHRLEDRNGDSLDLKTEKVSSLFPGPGYLTGESLT